MFVPLSTRNSRQLIFDSAISTKTVTMKCSNVRKKCFCSSQKCARSFQSYTYLVMKEISKIIQFCATGCMHALVFPICLKISVFCIFRNRRPSLMSQLQLLHWYWWLVICLGTVMSLTFIVYCFCKCCCTHYDPDANKVRFQLICCQKKGQ